VPNAPVGLLTLRLPSLGWVFLSSSLRLRFPFYLGPLSPVYLLAATQGLAPYSCFTTQSFWYSLKDLLAQLSATISSLVVSLCSEFICSTPSPSVLENWVFLFFEFWDLVLSVGELGFLFFEFWDPFLSFGSVWVL